MSFRQGIHVVVDVLFDLVLASESSPAVRHRAAKGSFPLMSPDVLIEYGFLPKVFTALRTFIRFLSRVYSQMLI